jgi:2-polyprenyl-3-methyl-5-hydroxy-6-metoxy-1,4-benzoquinol methylase
MILCGDTWICHDHNFRNNENKDPEEYKKSLESGRRIFREKYHGLDAWDDINNFEHELLSPLDNAAIPERPTALCVDVQCGTPVLEIRNSLRKRGITDVQSYAFTTQAKYFTDLQAVASQVHCDRAEFIREYYGDSMFDIITLGEPINTYNKPVSFLQNLFGLLKPNGILLFKVRNTDDYNSFLRTSGIGGIYDNDSSTCLTVNEVFEQIKLLGGREDIAIKTELYSLNENDQKTIYSLLKTVNSNANDNDLHYLFTRNFCFCAIKK